jgi:hypothetical protein
VFEYEDSLPEEFNPVFQFEIPNPVNPVNPNPVNPNLPQINPKSVQQVNPLPVQEPML